MSLRSLVALLLYLLTNEQESWAFVPQAVLLLSSSVARRSAIYTATETSTNTVTREAESTLVSTSVMSSPRAEDSKYAAVYEQIGIKEGELALGVNPQDFLTYIGTREDIVVKTMADLPSLDRAAAEAEVDRFLLDQEMVNYYLEFQRRKAVDPDFAVPAEQKDDGLFSFRNLVIVYLTWVGATTVPALFRRWVADREAAGEWEGTNIPFLDEWIQNNPVGGKVVEAASDAVLSVTDAVVQSSSGL